jgi:hypothetical protein
MGDTSEPEVVAILSEEDMARLREPSREAVARRAFELFLARGGAHGKDVDDWLRAERELTRPGKGARPTR